MNFCKIYLGFGSNIGNRVREIEKAVGIIKNNPHFKNLRVSRFYESSPVGPRQRDFVNGVVAAETDLSPVPLLKFLKETEKKLGRKKRKVKWSPREIDIDILFYGKRTVNKKSLKIPHPEIANRLFMLTPLCDIAPGFSHPVLKKTVRKLRDMLLLTCTEQKVKIFK